MRLRYRFDNALSRGSLVVIAYLAVLTIIAILLAGSVATAVGLQFGEHDQGFGESAYQSLLRMLDPGTFSDDSSESLRALTLVVTVVGIVLGGCLIGLIANAVDQRVERLQQGRGRVVERDHSLVLGWSGQVPQIIAELVLANESRKRACIVVLAKTEKTTMEDAIRDQVRDLRTTRVVVRVGDPSLPSDLERVCVADARSIVVVRDDDGDAGVIKAVLAVRALDPTHDGCHVVAEVADPHDAHTLRTVSHGRVVTVSSRNVIAEVTAQACYQGGLATVFTDFLDFDGDEIYFAEIPAVVGHTYERAQTAFEGCAVIGRSRPSGGVELNPAPATVLEAGDHLVFVAADDSAVVFTGFVDREAPPVTGVAKDAARPVRALVVGWSSFGNLVLAELDEFLVAGSSIHVQVDEDLVDLSEVRHLTLAHASLTAAGGRGGPEDLMCLADEGFDQVIVLAYRDALSAADADARTLLALLTLRLIWPATEPQHVRVVAELVDQRNAVIAAPAGIDDLIMSDALTALMIAQLSERPQLEAVFEQLFDPKGAIVVLLPAGELGLSGTVTFGEVVAAASAQAASAFGYRVAATGQVLMNPTKSWRIHVDADDRVIAVGARDPEPAAPRRRRARSSA